MIRLAFRKARVIEDNLRSGTFLQELQPDDGVVPRIPVDYSPCLDDTLVRNKFEMSADDVSAEQRKIATNLGADSCGNGAEGFSRLHFGAQPGDLVERLGLSERVVDTLAVRFKDIYLVNGFF